jgi:hypothetical protein
MQVCDLRGRLPDVKRDLNLLRDLLLWIEADSTMDGTREYYFDPNDREALPDFSGHSFDEIAYHVNLLVTSGFVDGAVTVYSPRVVIRKLTWDGHEFLDNIRSDTFWGKAKTHFASLPSVSIRVIAAYVQAEIVKHYVK